MPNLQTSVTYQGSKIIPAPFVSLTRNIERTADGTSRQRGWKIQLTGKVSAVKGSPDETGTFWTTSGYPPDTIEAEAGADKRMRNFRNKLGALERLFDVDGKSFEIHPPDGSAPLKFYPRIQSFNFAEGQWFEFVDYTVEMEADCIYFGNDADLFCDVSAENNPAEETWAIDPIDDFRPTYRLTHTVTAGGKKRFVADGTGDTLYEGWEAAKISVDAALGYSSSVVTSIFGVSGTTNYNYNASKSMDKATGRYQVTESWILSENNYIEDKVIDISFSLDSGFYTGRVSGTITGLNTGTDASLRYTNANTRFSALTEAACYSLAQAEMPASRTLNPTAMQTNVGRNKIAGIISYSYEFNNRPAVTSGYLSEQINVSIDHATPVVAAIGVIARPYGPVLQDTGSYTQKMVTITADILIRTGYGEAAPTAPAYNPYPEFITTVGGTPPTVYVSTDKENWSRLSGRYNRTTSYIYQSV